MRGNFASGLKFESLLKTGPKVVSLTKELERARFKHVMFRSQWQICALLLSAFMFCGQATAVGSAFPGTSGYAAAAGDLPGERASGDRFSSYGLADSLYRFQPIKIFRDDRAELTDEDETWYSGTQRIECIDPAGRGMLITSGTLAGGYRHGIGVAHAFYERKSRTKLRASDCRFVVYDRTGSLQESIAITRFKSRRVDDGSYGDPNSDIMMFEIEREPEYVYKALGVRVNAAVPGTDVLVVGFYADADPSTAKRKSYGSIYPKKGTEDDLNDNIFVTDVAVMGNTSGSPILARATGRVIGMVRGAPFSASLLDNSFDARKNYNQGIMLDERFLRDFLEFRKTTCAPRC